MLGMEDSSNDYLSSLPSDIQEEISRHPGDFHSDEELHKFANNLMKRS
jgi:hypothetical protein